MADGKSSAQTKSVLINLGVLVVALAIAFIILEVFLRYYNPFESRVKGDKIILRGYKDYSLLATKKNEKNPKLDKLIKHTKNSLGFRGAEPPSDIDRYLTLITVGGSTTECMLLSDNKTWPNVLGEKIGEDFYPFWINNAGLDGHSTFGHAILLEDYLVKLRPKLILFLVGLNDIGLETLNIHDRRNIDEGLRGESSLAGLLSYLKENSEVYILTRNIDRSLRASARELDHHSINVEELPLVEVLESTRESILQLHREKYLVPYAARLKLVIDIARRNGSEPILVTQPALYGDQIDPITGVDLGKIRTSDGNGKLSADILELYNEVTRKIGRAENILVVDLARQLPKSSQYYYDFWHFTNEGAEKIATILYKSIAPFLSERYQSYKLR